MQAVIARAFVLQRLLVLAALALATTALADPASASTWDSLRSEIFGDRVINVGTDVVKLKAPFRPEDQRAVPVGVDAAFTDGRSVKSITVIIDENPSPVATVLRAGPDRKQVSFTASYRFNRKTDVRAVVEASDGQLYMAHAFVRYAGGQSACSAPPNGNAEEIAANMGKMKLSALADASQAREVTPIHRRARLELKHPNFTGMQMDQMTLLYYPMHIIDKIEIRQGGDVVMQMENGISVSENPVIDFNFDTNGTGTLHVIATDTKQNVYRHSFPVGPGT